MKILCKLKYGSHLYGCNTPTSDIDFKGIYLPSLNDYLL
jgi:predicted nucleotidyltransferase